MNYAYKITTHGRNAIAASLAMEVPFHITHVAFGSGRIGEDAELADTHELLEYVSDGAVGNRSHRDGRLKFTIQYANSEHKTAPDFLLSEFIVYVRDPETKEETDLLYGTLGDYRQPVPAYDPAYPPSVFNFPLEIILSSEITVQISAPAGLATWDDLKRLKFGESAVKMELSIPAGGWVPDADGGGYVHLDLGSAGISESQIPILTVLPESLGAAAECGLLPVAQTLPGMLRLYARSAPERDISAVLTLLGDAESRDEILIPTGGWTDGEDAGYPLQLDLPCASAAKDLIPILTIVPESLEIARACGLAPVAQTLDGILRLLARSQPAEPVLAKLVLIRNGQDLLPSTRTSYNLPAAGGTTLGGVRVRPGSGLTIDSRGYLSLDAATAEDVAGLFQGSGAGGESNE